MKRALLLCVVLTAACGPLPVQPADGGQEAPADAGLPPPADAGLPGVPVLGMGAHTLNAVRVDQIAGRSEGLNRPRDLAFNPLGTQELWVANHGNNSMFIAKGAGTSTQTVEVRRGKLGGEHFMPRPAALAFGKPGFMATAHEEDRVTQSFTPPDFMGPTLWPTDSTFEGGHDSHMDMLHNSPNAVGIAWEKDNVYWVFDGYHNSVTRYDFAADHGPAGTDHSDGVISRYVEGQVRYVKGVSSHMELDRTTHLLYIADTGNARVAVLDITQGTKGAPLTPNYDGGDQHRMNGTQLTTLVGGAESPLKRPSGLALGKDLLFIGDHETSTVFAFNLEGKLLDYLDLSPEIRPGSLSALELDAEGNLYLVDNLDERVLRIRPRTQ